MLKWVFGADTSPFDKGLKHMRGEVKAFSSSVSGMLAGALGVGALTAWISATLDAAGRIDDLSKRLNMSAESFQRLSYASKMSGGDMEVVGKGLTILTKNLADAEKGSDNFASAAKTLQVDLGALSKMSPEGQMVALAEGYAKSANKGAALNAIMKLLGKSGAELIPMLAEGPEALQEMFDEATIASDNQIASLAKVGDAIDALKLRSVAALGSIIDGFKVWAAYAEYALNKVFSNGGADDQLTKRMDAIMYSGKGTNASVGGDTETSEKTEKDKEDLTKEIAKLEEESRLRQLSLDEKILDLKKKQAELAAESVMNDQGSIESLEARKEELRIAEELEKLSKEKADLITKDQDAATKFQDEIANLKESEARVDRDNRLAGMSNPEKLKALKAEQADLIRQSKDAFDKMETLKGIEKRTEAKQLQPEIDNLSKTPTPTILTSDLKSIGGGGPAMLLNGDKESGTEKRLDNVLRVLERIDNKTPDPNALGPDGY